MNRAGVAALIALLALAILAIWVLFATKGGDAPTVAPAEQHTAATEPTGSPPPAASAPIEARVPDGDRASKRTPAPPPAGTCIEGRVVRRGAPVARRLVRMSGDKANGDRVDGAETRTDEAGAFRFAVAPGSYSVAVPTIFGGVLDGTATGNGVVRHGTGAAAREDVVVGSESIRVELLLPPGRVEIAVRDAVTGAAVAGAQVTSDASSGWAIRRQELDARGRAVFDELHTWTYRFRAHAPMYLDSPKHEVTLTDANPLATVEIALEPAAALVLRMTDERRMPVEFSNALRLELRHLATDSVQKHDQPGDLDGRTLTLRYSNVPPGAYRVEAGSESAEDRGWSALRYQPVDVFPPLALHLPTGEETIAELRVRRRAYVTIASVDSQGTFAPAELIVRALDDPRGELRVLRATGTLKPGVQFDAYLPPGAYALEFSDRGRTHTERLTVGREPIEHRVTLPW